MAKNNSAARRSASSEPKVKLNKEQRKLLTLLFGAIVIISAGVLLISAPRGSAEMAQLAACSSLQSAQQYNCVFTLANQTGNTTYCSYLSGSYAGKCVSAVTIKQNSRFSCSDLGSNSVLYPLCVSSYAEKSLNASACAELGSGSYGCVLNISVEENFSNPSICGKITNSSMESICSDAYAFKKAIVSSSASSGQQYCAALTNQSNINQTLAMTFAYKPSFASLSYGYALSLDPRDYCYYALASETSNQIICNSITQQYSGQCFAQVGNEITQTTINYTYDFNATNPSTACNGSGPLNTTSCTDMYYLLKALGAGSYHPCNNITESTVRDSCIYGVATLTGNVTECQYLTGNSIRALCYVNANLTSITQPQPNVTINTTTVT